MHTGMREALGNACALLRQVELALVKITSKRLVHVATTLALRHGTAHTVERCCTAGGRPRRRTVSACSRSAAASHGSAQRCTLPPIEGSARRALHCAACVAHCACRYAGKTRVRRRTTSAPGLAHICAGTLPHMLGKVSAASHHPPRPAALVSTRSHRVCLDSALTSHHSLDQCHRGAVLTSTH